MNQPQQNNNFTQTNSSISNDNPLKGYFRQYDRWISLPSKEMGIYPPDIAELNDDGEIGVMPMTSNDEIVLKNPDALLNGEAMRHVLKSCCPSIKDPDRMILNDVEALMVAIRLASYGKDMEMEVKCPECGTMNNVVLDLENVLNAMGYLNSEHSVVIQHKDGDPLRVHMIPYLYSSYLKLQKQSFEEEKIIRATQQTGDETLDEMKKIKKISECYTRIAHLNIQLMTECITKVTSESDENMVVEDRNHIREFVSNISRESAKKISNALEETTNVGINREYDVVCSNEDCGHQWKEKISFDPSSFF